MNTLAALIAVIATAWLSYHGFVLQNNAVIGALGILLFLFAIVLGFAGILSDIELARGQDRKASDFIITFLALPIVGAAIGIAYVDYRGVAPTYTVGAARTTDASAIVTLTNSQSTLSANTYDTFESPGGTDYQVVTGTAFYITQVTGLGMATVGSNVVVEIGYANVGVDSSGAPPAGAVTVWRTSYRAADGPEGLDLPVMIAIPVAKYPWLRATIAGNWQATGVVR